MRPADPEVDPFRRGARRRPLDPQDVAEQQGGPGLPRGRDRTAEARLSVSGVRRGRVVALAAAVLVTLVAVLGGVGIIPTSGTTAAAATDRSTSGEQASLVIQTLPDAARSLATGSPAPQSNTQDDTDVPADTGWGKRIVFDMSDQRVWLVGADDEVRRTYLVSG